MVSQAIHERALCQQRIAGPSSSRRTSLVGAAGEIEDHLADEIHLAPEDEVALPFQRDESCGNGREAVNRVAGVLVGDELVLRAVDHGDRNTDAVPERLDRKSVV